MRGYRPILSFGTEVAEEYDATNIRGDEVETVAFLAGLANGGPVLELAIGTGRIAIPLAATGLRVDGIELSPAMAGKLKSRPGADGIDVKIGDFADIDINGKYRLIYVIYNTFFNLLTQEDQVRCFQNVAKHLEPDGVFVLEALDPGYLHRLRDHQYVDAESIEMGKVMLDVGQHDPVAQILSESHVELSKHGVRLFPIVCRFCWPSELDLMARLAGLQLLDRWGGWNAEPFTAESRRHVSTYGFDPVQGATVR